MLLDVKLHSDSQAKVKNGSSTNGALMPTYKYVATNEQGETVKGSLDAATESNVVSSLRQKGYYATKIKLVKTRGKQTQKRGFVSFLRHPVLLFLFSVVLIGAIVGGIVETRNGINVIREGWFIVFVKGFYSYGLKTLVISGWYTFLAICILKGFQFAARRKKESQEARREYLLSFSPILCHRCKYQGIIGLKEVPNTGTGVVAGFGEDGIQPLGFFVSRGRSERYLICPKCNSPDHWETIRDNDS